MRLMKNTSLKNLWEENNPGVKGKIFPPTEIMTFSKLKEVKDPAQLGVQKIVWFFFGHHFQIVLRSEKKF